MKILIVAMSDSIHTARWISQVADQGWEIHLFPSIDCGITNKEIKNTVVYHGCYSHQKNRQHGVQEKGIPVYFKEAAFLARKVFERYTPDYRINQLARLIDKLQPDIVHSLEIQHSGYLTMEARKRCRRAFPPWIVTNWGSDIYLFGRLAGHEPKIREILSLCNYYSCECRRDVCLAEAYGFTGTVLPVFPNTGGFDLDAVERLRQPGPVSARRLIMLKGYQHWAGRALAGLRALERCADMLGGYEVAIYCATPEVALAAELFTASTGVRTLIVPKDSPHQEILRLHGRARLSIGLSISDAISTSFLEALVMGSFPIQSWTACADEWIEDGKSGLLVPPEDPDVIEQAIRRALIDDDLMDKAAAINAETTRQRLDQRLLREQAIGFYRTVCGTEETACS